jgi:hypothetical protein
MVVKPAGLLGVAGFREASGLVAPDVIDYAIKPGAELRVMPEFVTLEPGVLVEVHARPDGHLPPLVCDGAELRVRPGYAYCIVSKLAADFGHQLGHTADKRCINQPPAARDLPGLE